LTDQRPGILAGHSFGEISALTCASSINFEDAVMLSRMRGKLMQSAVADGVGAMAAILGLEDALLEELCQQVSVPGRLVEAVNYNAPGQVVVAGHSDAVDELLEMAKDKGAKRAIKLPVSVPAHSSLMQPAAEQFAEVLAEITMNLPAIPVIQNASLAVPASVDELKNALKTQLHSPVQWVKTIKKMQTDDIQCLLELGPGKVLAGLTKRIDKTIASAGIFDNASLEAALKMIEG
jgi:[acyl-carrier-protein] S-malonyltransferase